LTFLESTKCGFQNYATFDGRASRSEFWYWALFTIGGVFFFSIIDYATSGTDWVHVGFFGTMFSLVTLLPSIAVTLRRCRDANLPVIWAIPPILFASSYTASDAISYTSSESADPLSDLLRLISMSPEFMSQHRFLALTYIVALFSLILVPLACKLIIGLKGTRQLQRQDYTGIQQ
jgi:uncharacterized membrane protein YhaH (DUF805 family)